MHVSQVPNNSEQSVDAALQMLAWFVFVMMMIIPAVLKP